MAIGACAVCILLVPGAQAAEFIPLGDLPGGAFSSTTSDVSDDGSVVVGWSNSGDDQVEAFRWTAETGMVNLGDLPGGFIRGRARGVSADGSVVVGQGSLEGPSIEAFRWTSAGGMVGIGDLAGGRFESNAEGISADGSVVVGISRSAPGQEAFRWTSAGGMVGLSDLSGGDFNSEAFGASGDGSVVVGIGSSASGDEAFRWTEPSGIVGLGDLPGGGFHSQAFAASADGSVVVGFGSSASGREAFRWTNTGGMVGLGDLAGGEFDSVAVGVSADGSVVVGNSRTGSEGGGDPTSVSAKGNVAVRNSQAAVGDEFFVWTQANGMQRLQDILVANGTTGLDGWTGLGAGSISDNGRWVVGTGTNPSGFKEAFLVQLPTGINQGFEINSAISDAWFFPDTSGQGFFIIVWEDSKLIFLSWFTYETERPPEDLEAVLGEPGHRWVTALGPYEGDTALLDVFLSSGMIFDSAEPAVTTEAYEGATIEIVWSGCNEGVLKYDIPALGLMGEIPIQRIVLDNVAACEAGQLQ